VSVPKLDASGQLAAAPACSPSVTGIAALRRQSPPSRGKIAKDMVFFKKKEQKKKNKGIAALRRQSPPSSGKARIAKKKTDKGDTPDDTHVMTKRQNC
jgi:hypothetical protein